MKKLVLLASFLTLAFASNAQQEGFVGEIRIFAGSFAPKDWMFCQGQSLMIAQNTALFSILGVTYGGNGKTDFKLPDLTGRAPIGTGRGTVESGQIVKVDGAPTGPTSKTSVTQIGINYIICVSGMYPSRN